ncbi:MAG: N-acetyltransferase [Candidatus Bathyarchaeota archaeon]|nr:N-acetyltransferase [Candidatus Bathyarchaeota archaeon]
MNIRETTPADINDILYVEREAFQRDSEVNITRDMLSDPSAEPRVSLLAFVENQPVGHILFTRGYIEGNPRIEVSFLAPLAVIPNFQKQRIGGALIKEGIKRLLIMGVDLVFVIGHPEYYPRFGFAPASKLGFQPTYPLPAEVAAAWMVLALRPNIIGATSGKVICCDVMNKPEVWHQ